MGSGGPGGFFGTNPETGSANNPVGQLWQGITGKRGPTAPQLPRGFEWLGSGLKDIFSGASQHLNYGTADALGQSGAIGALGSGALGAGIGGHLGDVTGTFGNALGGINEGINTGYLPQVSQLDALLRPALERSFDAGSADIREQAALTGGLSSSGATDSIRDYRAQLENNLGNNIAGILGGAVPASISARSGASALGANLPGILQGNLFGSMAGQGLEGQSSIAQLLGLATGGAGSAPLYSRQGSEGNGAVGALGSAYLSSKAPGMA